MTMVMRSLLKLLKKTSKRNSPETRNSNRRKLTTEKLEERSLLAVVWANQGSPTNDSDQFNLRYGANSNAARAIVNEAIADWNRIVTGAPVNLSVNISAALLTAPTLGQTTVNTRNANNVPMTATIQLDDNGAGSNWFFDPTPSDDSEFSSLITGWSGTTTATTAHDLYTTVLRQIGNALGYAGNSTDPNDLMSATGSTANRRLISNATAQLLASQFGYTISLPSQTDTLHVSVNSVGNSYSVVGGAGVFNDTVVIDKIASGTRVTVNGFSEPLAGQGLTGWNTFTINTFDGNDTIQLQDQNTFWGGGVVNAGAGNDLVIHSALNFDYSTTYSSNAITRQYLFVGPSPYTGGISLSSSEDVLFRGSTGADVYIIGAGNTSTFVRVYGGAGNDNINALNSSRSVFMYGEAGNDTLVGSQFADILIGGNDNDTLTGNQGRDILIGGAGADTITAMAPNNDEDIVIAGSTSFDATSSVSQMVSIWQEWTSTRTRAQRIANISGSAPGTRLNTVFLTLTANAFSAQTVFDDGVFDSLGWDSNIDWVILA